MILGADAGAHLTCRGLWPGVRWRPLEKELNLPNPLGSAWAHCMPPSWCPRGPVLPQSVHSLPLPRDRLSPLSPRRRPARRGPEGSQCGKWKV